MQSKEELRKERRINHLANKKIEAVEKQNGRKVNNEEIVEIFDYSEKAIERRMKIEEKRKKADRNKRIRKIKRAFKKIKNTLVIALSAVGIVFGVKQTHKMLTSGEETQITNDNSSNSKNAKDANQEFRNSIKTDLVEENSDKKQELIDEILKNYNEKLPGEDKIDKEDLGIIFQENMGEGNIIRTITDDGEVKYRENVTADVKDNEQWVQAKDINSIYILVDNTSQDTIAGIGNIKNADNEYEYVEVTAEKSIIDKPDSRIEYTINEENYVEVDNIKNEQQVNMQDIYESFEQYYFNRVQKDKIAKEDIEMENGI